MTSTECLKTISLKSGRNGNNTEKLTLRMSKLTKLDKTGLRPVPLSVFIYGNVKRNICVIALDDAKTVENEMICCSLWITNLTKEKIALSLETIPKSEFAHTDVY